jgi:dynein heavy chain
MYPSLVNCTTIDLFADWPQDALLEVGERYLSQIELAGDEKVNNILNRILIHLKHCQIK